MSTFEARASFHSYVCFGEGRLVRYDLDYVGRGPLAVQVITIQTRLMRDGLRNVRAQSLVRVREHGGLSDDGRALPRPIGIPAHTS